MLFIRKLPLCRSACARPPRRCFRTPSPLRTEAGTLRCCGGTRAARRPRPGWSPGVFFRETEGALVRGGLGARPRGPPRSGLGRRVAGGHLQPPPRTPCGLPSPARGADPRDLSWTQRRAQLGAARPRPPPQGPARGRVRPDRTRLLGVSAAGGHTHPRKLYSIFPAKVIILRRTKRKNLYVTSRGASAAGQACGRRAPRPRPQALAPGGVHARGPAAGPPSHLNFLDETRTSADASA